MYRPAGQGAHADASASRTTPSPAKWYRFAAHATHATAPRCDANCPAPHAVHAAALVPVLKLPAAHGEHTAPPRKLPATQSAAHACALSGGWCGELSK